MNDINLLKEKLLNFGYKEDELDTIINKYDGNLDVLNDYMDFREELKNKVS